MVSRWRAMESAIAQVQADMGWIPREAAEEIDRRLADFPVEMVQRKREETGHLFVAFLKAFREHCGPAAEHMHVGPTTQDILDTGLVLMIGETHGIVLRSLLTLEDALCARADEHAGTVTMGRSHAQHAVPTTFGLILAGWALEVRDHFDRARESEARWRCVSLSGAVGSRSAFVEMGGVEQARELEVRVGERLGLRAPDAEWHARTDRLAEPVENLAALLSSLSKMASNLCWRQAPEVAEAFTPHSPSAYSSSTMPIKRNPEALEHIVGAAALARGYAAAMQSISMLDNRDGSRVPVEFTALPQSYGLAHRSLLTMIHSIETLEVDAAAMRRNLDHPNVGGAAAGERLMIALYRKTGRRDWAHTALHDCAVNAAESGQTLREAIARNAELGPLFEPGELEALLDLTSYAGTAELETRQTVAALRKSRLAIVEAAGRTAGEDCETAASG